MALISMFRKANLPQNDNRRMSLNDYLRYPLIIGLLALFVSATPSIEAHEARPVAVEIIETAINQFSVAMKMPSALPRNGLPVLSMPVSCNRLSEPMFSQTRSSYVLQASYQCERQLAGQTLTLMFPGNQASVNTLFQLTLQSGEYFSHLLSPVERAWIIPRQENRITVAWQYTGLGIKHIITGIDHLLFVACLVFIAASWRRILITVTGFTVAHSATLFLSALNLVSVPLTAVEAVIALSILFLAHEIAVDNHNSWTWRYPTLVSSSFGLLHGFGFSAVLKEVGLPPTELITGLLFFNLGVEIGQVAFIVCLFLLAKLANCSVKPFMAEKHTTIVRQLANYALGIVAAYWFIARLVLL